MFKLQYPYSNQVISLLQQEAEFDINKELQKKYDDRFSLELTMDREINALIEGVTSSLGDNDAISVEEKNKTIADLRRKVATSDDFRVITSDKYNRATKDLCLIMEAIFEIRLSKKGSPAHIPHYCDKMKQLIGSQKADVNFVSFINNFTPLLTAAFLGDADLMGFLIENGADPSLVSSDGNNVLHTAISNGNSLAILAALSLGGQIDQVNKNGETPVESSFKHKHIHSSILEILLMRRPDDASLDRFFEKALSCANTNAYAIVSKYKFHSESLGDELVENLAMYDIVKLLEIKQAATHVSAREKQMLETLIHEATDKAVAIAQDKPKAANILLCCAIDTICRTIDHIESSKDARHLYVKAFETLMNLAVNLIEAGADINLKGKKNGLSTLHLASYFDLADVIESLIAKGANTKDTTFDGSTILHLNVLDMHSRSLEFIKSSAPDLINIKKNDGETALHCAVKNNFKDIAKQLLQPLVSEQGEIIKKGANRKLINRKGETALHIAVKKNASQTVSDLLENYHDPKFINLPNYTNGNTALHDAALHGFDNIAAILIEAGADVNVTNKTGHTAGDYAKGKTASLFHKVEAVAKEQPSQEALLMQLQQSVASLQKRAAFDNPRAVIKDPNCDKDLLKMLSLIDQTQSHVDAITVKGCTALHIAAKFGKSDIVATLLSKGANINAKTDANMSVLACSFRSLDADTIKCILAHNITLASFCEDFKAVISSGNKPLVTTIVHQDETQKLFADCNEKQIKTFLGQCNRAVKPGSKANAEAMKAQIKSFFNTLISSIQATTEDAPAPPPQEEMAKTQGLTKKEQKQALKKAKQEEVQQKDAQRKFFQEQEKKRISEVQHMTQEDHLPYRLNAPEALPEDKQKKANSIDTTDVGDTSSVTDSFSTLSPSHSIQLTPEALEIVARYHHQTNAPVFTAQEQKDQMQAFLSNGKNITSITDVPAFIQAPILALLDEGYRVLLRGSRVNGRKDSPDLDVEIIAKDIWSHEDDIHDILEKFNVKITKKEQVYRGKNDDNRDFTVNVKDEDRALDITIYDDNSPSRFSWLNSKEEKISFNRDGSTKRVKSDGFLEYARRSRESGYYLSDYPERDIPGKVVFNRRGHSLVLRSIFQESIDFLHTSNLEDLAQAIFPKNPIDLLYKELKINSPHFIYASNQEECIAHKLSTFVQSHGLKDDAKVRFFSNLSSFMNYFPHSGEENTGQHSFYPMIQHVIETMKYNAIQDILTKPQSPSSTTNKHSATNLQKAEVAQKKAEVAQKLFR